MATVINVVCDRCGGLITKKSSTYVYTLSTETTHRFLLSSTRNIDLCEDCKIELEDWLNGNDFSTEVTGNDD